MYKPSYFNEESPEKLHNLIRENSFATLISVVKGEPVISHLPFFLKGEDKKTFLLSHMAKANPHWEIFEKNPKVTVIFQGPHAYISPAWYPPSPVNVPTWNYAVVHAQGVVRVLREPSQVWETMGSLISKNESLYGKNWTVDKAGVQSKMTNIVAFEIEVTKLDGKFKLSQQHPQQTREQVAKELLKSPNDHARATGKLMLNGPKDMV